MIFLAIGLHVKENYGASKVVYTFLIQGLPPFLFSGILSRLVPENRELQTFYLLQFLISIFAFSLVFFESLTYIYIYLFVSSFIATLTNPLFTTIASKSVEDEQWSTLHTRVSAIRTSVMAFAPMAGGSLSIWLGISTLYIMTGVLFILAGLIALVFVKVIKKDIGNKNKNKIAFFKKFLYVPPTKNLRHQLIKWCLFLVMGALLNSVEFFVFEDLNLTRFEIGTVISFWGLGGLFAYILTYKNAMMKFESTHLIIIYGLVMAILSSAPSYYVLLAAFFIGGCLQSSLSGNLRDQISKAIPKGERTIEVWASTNQWMGLINIIFYSVGATLITELGTSFVSLLFVLITILMILFRSKEEDISETNVQES